MSNPTCEVELPILRRIFYSATETWVVDGVYDLQLLFADADQIKSAIVNLKFKQQIVSRQLSDDRVEYRLTHDGVLRVCAHRAPRSANVVWW